ncbi:Y-family DNA polymerase [Chryseosolibacter indicus]|uniref:DNA polymerase Y family protein n=1 Tax=Chryseosolibacter indicus TaxID=2782351 RepID=A0ABS5VMI8_9BACT|nr:DNA polymerase Y family protein [Chryseosolibacter indicus]MBT1701944.1 DNA polymerase Y family protein [Chryseosolibacter indicus]
MGRFVSIWFRYLRTDWFSLRQPELKKLPFVLRSPSRGRMIITAANSVAAQQGLHCEMAVADAKALVPELQVQDDIPDLTDKLLRRLAEWCIRFTPLVAIDPPDGLLFDATGCSHLWGGDDKYIEDITRKLQARGYDVRIAMADTVGIAWGVARFGNGSLIIESGITIDALVNLPPEALRLEADVTERLHKLGLHTIRQFIRMPRTSLRRRFGQHFLQRLDKALGSEIEILSPVHPVELYQERLPCFDPVATSTGIEMALKELLTKLCFRLQRGQKGLRKAIFKGYRIDGKVEKVEVGTNRPSHHVEHLLKLFQINLGTIEPSLGIELFVLEAPIIEEYLPQQEQMWNESGGLEDIRLSELLDRLAVRIGAHVIHRYLPDEHYWPERSVKLATSLQEKPSTQWPIKPRPVQLLPKPEPIEVTAPIPDYPPMLFRYKDKVHMISKADGPERIEQEWWLQQGQHRDYYRVEDEEGRRYWIFRLGHYHDKIYQWFLHGFFA